MKVSIDKKTSTEGVITINLEEGDYKGGLEKKLKEYSKKMNLKGFRPGKVPVGLVNKMYGKNLKADEINHKASHGLEDFIKKENIHFIGDPILVPPENSYDFDSQKEFEIKFELGLVPDYHVPLDKKLKVNFYQVKEDKELMEQTLNNLRDQFGERSEPEISTEEDLLYGELRSMEGDLKKNAGISIKEVQKKGQSVFIGLSKEEEIEFQIHKILGKGNKGIIGNLGLSNSDFEALKGPFSFKVDSITRIDPAKIDQELFDKVFGKDVVKSEGEFFEKLKADISRSNEQESKNQFQRDIRKYLLEKTDLELSKDFLKKWLIQGGGKENKVSEEQLEKELPEYMDHLKWNLISNKIKEIGKIEVKPEDVRDETRKMIAGQFGGNLPAENKEGFIDQFTDNYLKEQDGKNFGQIYNSMMEKRIFDYLEEKIIKVEKKVNHKEFKKLLEG